MGKRLSAFLHDALDLFILFFLRQIIKLHGLLNSPHQAAGIKGVEQKAVSFAGFLFKTYDAEGLMWAIKQAMQFYNLPRDKKDKHIKRVMQESTQTFTHDHTARQYIELYEKMLQRPLVLKGVTNACSANFDNNH